MAKVRNIGVNKKLIERDDGTQVLAAPMTDGRHLQPGWQPPWLNRPAKQKWANWVRGWQPMSAQGRAAKACAYGTRAVDHRQRKSIAYYKKWLERPVAERQAAQEAAAQAAYRAFATPRVQAVPAVKRRAGRKLGAVIGVAAVSPSLLARLARLEEMYLAAIAAEAEESVNP